MSAGGPRLTMDIGLGSLLQAAVVAVGFGATWYFGGSNADVQARLAKHDAVIAVNGQRITAVEALQQQQREDIKSLGADMRQGVRDIVQQLNDLRAARK